MKLLHDSLSRRSFLRRTALTATSLGLAAGLPNVVTRRVAGATVADTIRKASDGIRVGLIGVGNQGRGHLLMNVYNVVAVCEVDKTRLEEAKVNVKKQANHDCATYTDYRKLLDNKEVDAVIVVTPDHWHALQAIHACQAGKDVYVEKPLTLVMHEGQVMVQAARRYNRIVQTGSQQRSDDKFRLACELVRSGRLGKVHTVKVGIPGVNYSEKSVPDSEPPAELDYELWLGPAPWRAYNKNRVHYNFRFFWNYSGGQMTNWGAHHLDIAQWGLGMDESGPVSIEGQGDYDPEKRFEVPVESVITYQYANGVKVILEQKPNVKIGATFIGDKGSIYVNRGKLESTPEEIIEQPLGDQDVHLYVSTNHHINWFECIKSRKLPICDVAIGHRSATICHLGNIALRTGRKIHWDPVKEVIVGDAEANRMLAYAYRAPWEMPQI